MKRKASDVEEVEEQQQQQQQQQMRDQDGHAMEDDGRAVVDDSNGRWAHLDKLLLRPGKLVGPGFEPSVEVRD
jgi:hypothetical protein